MLGVGHLLAAAGTPSACDLLRLRDQFLNPILELIGL